MLRVQNLSFSYGTQPVLREISFTAPLGSCVGILGESGCGKTTLLKLIAGLLPPQSGQVVFNDRDLTELEAAKRNVGYVSQLNPVDDMLTARQNISMGINDTVSSQERIERIKTAAAKAELNQCDLKKPAEMFSGGQKKRIGLARLLAGECSILLLDEPLSSLDTSKRRILRQVYKSAFADSNRITILVTHDSNDIAALATHVGVMSPDGHLIQFGTTKQVCANPADEYVSTLVVGDRP